MDRDKFYDNDLLDYYGSLLTEHQNKVMGLYLGEDLSMGEIAEMLEVSKTAVADLIRRCYKQLDSYEKHLGLIVKEKQRETVYQKLIELENKEISSLVDKLKELK